MEKINFHFFISTYLIYFQANQAGSSSAMEFLGHQKAFHFLLSQTQMIITTFISDRHSTIAKWMRESRPAVCAQDGKPAITPITHLYDRWHVAKCKLLYVSENMVTIITIDFRLGYGNR